MTKLLLCLTALGASLASAATYTVTLHEPSVIAGSELKAGNYKFSVNDNKVSIKSGKNVMEADAKVETNDSKYANTSVRYNTQNGKNLVEEVHVGGTRTKLVFGTSAVSATN